MRMCRSIREGPREDVAAGKASASAFGSFLHLFVCLFFQGRG